MYKRIITLLAMVSLGAAVVAAQTDEAQLRMLESMAGKKRVDAKKPGTIRIGIAMPATEMGKDFTMTDTPMAVINTLQVALTEETVETVLLNSALPEKEAKLKKCDYVFISKVTRKKGGGGFGGLGGLG
ncbi:MAG: hypothetical protein ABR530_10485, partial [Pyrinomonadaceae bacterium]